MAIIKLQSNDDKIFEVDEAVARKSKTIDNLLESMATADESETIPIPRVDGRILELVLKWAEQHKDEPEPTEQFKEELRYTGDIPKWDQQFLAVDQKTLFEITLAANFLDVNVLFKMACKTVANQIKGKSPDEIRQHFNIENDLDK